MPEITNQFDIVFNQKKIRVQKLHSAGEELFRIIFDDETPPLILARRRQFWNSVPEGREELVEQIGQLIGQRHPRKL